MPSFATVSKTLGHSNTSTTLNIYTHLIEDTKNNVFGGYINSKIDSYRWKEGNELKGSHITDSNSFVFSLKSNGQLDKENTFDVELEPGSGPRHLCFSKDGRFAYLINELSGKVTTLFYNGQNLTPIQYIEADTLEARGSADIHLSPDGKFLYASNRLKADGIAIFSVDTQTGLLTKIGYQLTGIHPRNFIMTPDGCFLLVACRDDNLIQIFKRNKETGLLVDTGKKIETSKPVCLKFI